MLVINDIISQSEVQEFKKYFLDHRENEYINWKQKSGDALDVRLNIKNNNPEFKIIENVVKRFAPDVTDIWSAYQRQNFPHNIHIDEYHTPNPNAYTIVIAMDTIPEFKTIVWQEKLEDNKALVKYVFKWGNNNIKLEKKNNISETEDLEHTPKNKDNNMFCDYLTLDGIFSYVSGSGVLFNARKFHCTSNWVKYPQFKYRDLLQIHFLTENFHDF